MMKYMKLNLNLSHGDVASKILGKVGQKERQEMQVVKSRYCKEWAAEGFTSSLSVVKASNYVCAED